MLHNRHPAPYPMSVGHLNQSLITLADKVHHVLAVVIRKSLCLAHEPLQRFARGLGFVLLNGLGPVSEVHNDCKKAHAILRLTID